MESNVESNLFELQVDHDASNYLRETARWAKFMAIVGFICCGLFVLIALFAGSMMATTFGSMGAGRAAGIGGAVISVVYIAIALLYFFPCLYLYNFASKMQVALRSNDQGQLNQSFKNLKACYRFLGILMIIGLCIWALAFVIGIAGAAFR